MINKEQFIEYMTRYKELCDKEKIVNDTIGTICTDFNGIYLSYHHMLILDMLRDLINDKNERIFSYIYDYDWGEDFEEDDIDDDFFSVNNFSDLYDYIMKENQ